MYQYAPSKIDFTLNNGYSWDGHDKSTDSSFIKYGQAIKEAQIQMGLLKTSDSAFFALNLLKKHPRIAKYLAFKFQYLIIDEAQDTSEAAFHFGNSLSARIEKHRPCWRPLSMLISMARCKSTAILTKVR
ncbi:MAG: UvrD-helicase domain-containing protein [Saprospiraceae bacterium]|nr:UvrD-helicase domain-containing protein [Saprospiraceae bacterium]